MKLTQKEQELVGVEYFYNAIKTPDGTILRSNSVHDYKAYVDGKTGETYTNDGGLYYAHRSINKVPAEDISLRVDADIEDVREVFSWGTYGKNGDEPFQQVLLKNMSNAHIKAIISSKYPLAPLFKLELHYRDEHGIVVEDYGITYYLTAEDTRYPTLVIKGEFGSVGYSVDRSTGELRRVCICAAHNNSECICGAWDLDIEDLEVK